MNVDKLVKTLNKSENIIIYGAGRIAKSVIKCLTNGFYNFHISYVAVSSKDENPDEIEGIPVCLISELTKYKDNSVVLIATVDKYLNEITKVLSDYKFENIVPFTFESKLWSEVRSKYISDVFKSKGKKYILLEDEISAARQDAGSNIKNADIAVYMAKSHVDKPLNSVASVPDWVIPIQAGAALTDKRVADLTDDSGDNISGKNKKYCELTVMYWIWKNVKADYKGLCHYRRHFDIDDETIKLLPYTDVDAVITTPILNYPSVKAVYYRDHISEDWNAMMDIMSEMYPDYYKAAQDIFSEIYYYPYNMVLAKGKCFDEYCAWLFPLLKKIESTCREKDDTYQNRYIGFLAERLTSLYFLYNSSRLKIAHTAKKFYM